MYGGRDGTREVVSLMPDKTVEFYLVDAFEIFHYQPIYEALLKAGIDAKMVAEPCQINTAGGWFDYDTAVDILQREAIKYSTVCNPRAAVAFTTQYPRNLSRYSAGTKRIALTYGVPLNKKVMFWFPQETIQGYDCMFVHGELFKNLAAPKMPEKNIVRVSYPKHLNFMKNKIQRNQVMEELHINPAKPVLLYLPTWDEYSSIPDFAEQMGSLREKFFVVAKPHHCTARLGHKRNDFEKILRNADLVLDANYSFYKTAMLGDVVVCDAKSGASTEIPFLRRDVNLVLVKVNAEKKDFVIDIDQFAYVAERPDQLPICVEKALAGDAYKKKRQSYVDYFYDRDIEKGLKNAVEIVKSMLNAV